MDAQPSPFRGRACVRLVSASMIDVAAPGLERHPPGWSHNRRGIRDVASAASSSLKAHGYAEVPALFTCSDLLEARMLLDTLFSKFETLSGLQSIFNGWAYDMVDPGRSRGHKDQPEILHATRIEPQLRDTRLFRKAALFAGALGLDRFRFDHAILKRPHGQARTPWHQDAPYSGSAQRRRPATSELHFWIPFEEANETNGCMEYVPGSHRLGLIPHQPFDRDAPTCGWMVNLPPDWRRKLCPTSAGTMLIHTPLTLHAAGANRTDRPRLAWILHFERSGVLRRIKHSLRGRAPCAQSRSSLTAHNSGVGGVTVPPSGDRAE